ncbi:MAG TPA: HlyD family efflux transporter periplasmic adaptor subunit [Polyangia bacterium]
MTTGFLGVVLLGDAVSVEPSRTSRILRVLVRVGDDLERGAPIAQLDLGALEQSLEEAEQVRAAAAARLRRRRLLARAAMPAVAAEELDNARFDLARERARVSGLKRELAANTLVAPFDGTVTDQYLHDGAVSGPGKPVVRVISRGTPRVRFAVPAEHGGAVAEKSPIRVTLPASDLRLSGQVTTSTSEVDVQSGMSYVTATLDLESHSEAAKKISNGTIVRVFVGESSAPPSDAPAEE